MLELHKNTVAQLVTSVPMLQWALQPLALPAITKTQLVNSRALPAPLVITAPCKAQATTQPSLALISMCVPPVLPAQHCARMVISARRQLQLLNKPLQPAPLAITASLVSNTSALPVICVLVELQHHHPLMDPLESCATRATTAQRVPLPKPPVV